MANVTDVSGRKYFNTPMNPLEIDEALDGMVCLVDSREQDTARLRARLKQMDCPNERIKLDFGDYSASFATGKEVCVVAERRMFAKTIVDSDAFLDMPISSQCLYFHLAMRADDEGFVNKAKSIIRTVGAKEEDFRPLIERRFVIVFDDGVLVIKHWRIPQLD